MTIAAFKALLGLDVALVQGPMGGVAGPELIAAVSNAGALGVLPIWADNPEAAARLIERTQSLTDRPFAVNLRSDLDQQEHVRVAMDHGVELFHLFWGDPSPLARTILNGNARFMSTIWDAGSAESALSAGASVLVAQGVEAGGHVRSETPLKRLLESVLPVAEGVPVIAAGAISSADDARAMVRSGASGVLCGTRFVASSESDAHPAYKQALVDAGADATARSLCYDLGWPDAPHRTLISDTYRAWMAAGSPPMGKRPGEGDVMFRGKGLEVPRYFVSPPKAGMTGDILEGALYAGTGVERIADVQPAAEIVRSLSAGLN